MATGSEPLGTIIWDAATGDELRRLKKPDDALPTSLSYSPDGRLLAEVNRRGDIRIYDPQKLGVSPLIYTFAPTATHLVIKAKFTADGRHLVTFNGNGTVYVLRLPPELH